jgi:hypothetical protein
MKITKSQLKELINEELNELDVSYASVEDSKYTYAKNMFYTRLRNLLDDFVKESDNKFDDSMKTRILRGTASVLGDRK